MLLKCSVRKFEGQQQIKNYIYQSGNITCSQNRNVELICLCLRYEYYAEPLHFQVVRNNPKNEVLLNN